MSDTRLSNLGKDLTKARQQALLIEVLQGDLDSSAGEGTDPFQTVCGASAMVFDRDAKKGKTNVLVVEGKDNPKPASIFASLLDSLDNEFDDIHKGEILRKLTGFGLSQTFGGVVGEAASESLSVGAERMMDYVADWMGSASEYLASFSETAIEVAADETGDLLESVGEGGMEAITDRFSSDDTLYLSRAARKRLKELAPRLSEKVTSHEALQLALEMLLVTAQGAPKVIVVNDPLNLDDASLALLAMLVSVEKDLRQIRHTEAEEAEPGPAPTAGISVVLTFTGTQPHDKVEHSELADKQRAISRLRMMASRYSLLERLDSDIPVPAVRASTFVGREAELNRLWQDWSTLCQQPEPSQTWCLVKGEPGTGKTALANRFIQQVRSDTEHPACLSIPTLRMLNQTGHSAQATGLASLKNAMADELRRLTLIHEENVGRFSRAYRKMTDAGRAFINDARSDDPEAWKRTLKRTGNLIGRLMDVDSALGVGRSISAWSDQDENRNMRMQEFDSSSTANHKEEQYKLLREGLRVIRELAQECTPRQKDQPVRDAPVLLLIDDLQWIDDVSAEFLLNEWPADLPTFVIATARGSDSFSTTGEAAAHQALNYHRNRLFATLGLIDAAPAIENEETPLSLASSLDLKGMDQPTLANLIQGTYAGIIQQHSEQVAAGIIRNLAGANSATEVITLFAIETLNVISDPQFYRRNPELPQLIEAVQNTDHYRFRTPDNTDLAEALDSIFRNLAETYQASYLVDAGQSAGARFNLASYAILEERLHLIEEYFGEYGGIARYSLLFSALLGSPFQSGLVQHVLDDLQQLSPEAHPDLAPFLRDLQEKARGSLESSHYELLERAYEIIRRLEENTRSTDRYVYQHGLLHQFLLGQFTQVLARVYPAAEALKGGIKTFIKHVLSSGESWFDTCKDKKASDVIENGPLQWELERKILSAELKRYWHQLLLTKGHGHGEWSISYVEALSDLAVIYEEFGRGQQARTLIGKAHLIAKKGYKESPESWAQLYSVLGRERAILELSKTMSIGSLDAMASPIDSHYLSEEQEEILYEVIWLLDNAIEVAESQNISSDELRFRDARLMAEVLQKLGSSWENILSEYEKASKACQRLYLLSPRHWQVDYTESLSDISWVFSELGQFEEALAEIDKATLMCQSGYHLSPDQWAKAYAKSLRVAAFCHKKIGNNDKALNLSHDALAIVKKRYLKFPERWAESYLRSLLCRADIYVHLEQPEQVLQIYEEALSVFRYRYEIAAGEWREDYLQSLADVALIYRRLGLPGEALLLYRESLPIIRSCCEESPNRWAQAYAANLHNLAISHDELGRKEEALPFFDEELLIRRRARETNPKTLAAHLNNLAVYHMSVRLPDYWMPLFTEALKIQREGYEYDPKGWIEAYTSTLTNLATAHENFEAPEKALPFYQEAVTIWRKCYESDSNSKEMVNGYSNVLNKLAFAYEDLGCLVESLSLYRDAIAIWHKAYESAQEEKCQLKSLFVEQSKATGGLFTKTESRIESDIQTFLKGYATSLNNLAVTLENLDCLKEALRLYEEAWIIQREGYEKAPEQWWEDHASNSRNLARALEGTQDLSRALDIWREAKHLTDEQSPMPREEKLGLRVELMIMSARLLRMLKHYPEAFSELDDTQSALDDMDSSAHPERHDFRAWSIIVRASTLLETGDLAAAKALFSEAEILIRDHSLEDLADALDSLRSDIESANHSGD